ncbi:MAG: trypsin-like peptidase domain-containing protein [Firmicutes bacterium]|nr:trypsin-like peptidase domain-containing protein [Bacillota bacterium]
MFFKDKTDALPHEEAQTAGGEAASPAAASGDGLPNEAANAIKDGSFTGEPAYAFTGDRKIPNTDWQDTVEMDDAAYASFTGAEAAPYAADAGTEAAPYVADDGAEEAPYASAAGAEAEADASVDGTGKNKSRTTYHYKGVSGKKEKRRFGWGTIALMALLFALCAAAAAFAAASVANSQAQQKIADLLEQKDTGILYRSVGLSGESQNNDAASLSVADTCDITVDSVVEIAIQTVNFNFFGQSVSEGAGSGVIITDNGYIVTNNHVVKDASAIRVILRNGEEYDATLVGRDEQADLAVIKIDAENLTPAVFGSSDELRVGDRVIAIGNPLGSLGGTVTVGYVSAKDRQITIEDHTMTLLQTDATINSGNSGGGLFNDKGELVGIAVAYASGIGVQGLNFFIPVNQVQPVVEDLMQYGYVRNRISLGVYLLDINDERTAANYRVTELGVYILGYTGENTNAQLDGLRAGDRLISIDGQAVEKAADVSDIIQAHNANDVITVVVSRNGQEKSVNVVLREEVPQGMENGATTPAGY